MVCIDSSLNIDLPPKQSAVLRGVRKTEKSTFLRSTFPDSLHFDQLNIINFLNFTNKTARVFPNSSMHNRPGLAARVMDMF